MIQNKKPLIKYGACFSVASLIVFIVFWIEGFFTDSVSVNIQILSDAFSIAGMVFLFIAGMLFISGEGALLGLGFILRNVVLIFVPMGRMKHEVYADYRERKLKERKRNGDACFLVTGLTFLAVGVIMMVIWYTRFYNIK